LTRRGLLPALVVFLGFSGAFQINLVRIDPSTTVRIVAVAATLIVVGISVLVARRFEPADPETLRELFENPTWGTPRGWRAQRKRMEIVVGGTGGTWRDTEITIGMTVENRSRRPLTVIDLPLVGETVVYEKDLDARIAVGGGQNISARVTRTDPHSPTIHVDLPAPGLARGATTEVVVSYRWPALAHLERGQWTCGLRSVRRGGLLELAVSYPQAAAQRAYVRHRRALWKLEWETKRGQLVSGFDGAHETIAYTVAKGRFDSIVVLDVEGR
jgi:hypothetical protein